ncbi:MAG: large repetitive protein [Thermoplasmata archaeon]|jgi:hypothetical protein|nr:large repetitive protein [Thermoplasmata archaeon]
MKSPAAVALLLCGALLSGCSTPASPDSDHDGLTDAEETLGWDIAILRVDGTSEARHVASDPAKWSTDGSALDDHYKFALGLDPRAPDTDGDGLTDCQEVRARDLAVCGNPDAPGPFDGGHGTLPNRADTDGDRLSDGAEVQGFAIPGPNGTRTVTSDPVRFDSDGDGLPDGQEAQAGADPRAADSDGDGCKDGLDADPLHDLKLVPGLRSLLWNGTARAHVQFVLNVGGASWAIPADSGVEVGPGENRSLAGLEPAPARPTCSFSPAHPWLPVQVLAYQVDGTPRALDLGVGSVAGYVNGRTGAFARSPDGEPVGGLALRGADGTLWLAPERLVA